MASRMDNRFDALTRGFSRLLGLQLVSRIVSFVFNLLIVRQLSPEEYGISVQFHLLTTTILFLSREGFRRGCLRVDAKKNGGNDSSDIVKIIGVCWLPIPLGILIIIFACGAWSFLYGENVPSGTWSYYTSVTLIGVATLVEILSEPFYIICHIWLRFNLRLAVESLAIFFKGLSTYLLLVVWKQSPDIAFATSQIIFALVTLFGYGSLISEIITEGGEALNLQTFMTFDQPTIALSKMYTLQAVEKLLLAEGSKYVLVFIENYYNQGVYGLVNNLGSLLVRTCFQPLEEASFTAFSRFSISKQDRSGMFQLSRLLTSLVRAVSLIGVLAATFGPPYAALFLRIVYSTKWSETDAPSVLACYCWYMPLLAINGMTEAFLHAVLDVQGLQKSNAIMLVVAALHLFSSVQLVKLLGAAGLVIADGFNMLMRITFSTWCICKFFNNEPSFGFVSLLPRPGTIFSACAIGLVIEGAHWAIFDHQLFENFLYQAIAHVFVGVVCLAVLLGVMYIVEQAIWRDLMTIRKGPSKEE